MDVTAAHIRREYACSRTLWVQVMGLGLTILITVEAARRTSAAGLSAGLVVALILLLGGAGYLLSSFLAQAVRRAGFEADLWRKFGLDLSLLDAVAKARGWSDDAAQTLDAALRDLRSLAAVANQADASEVPDQAVAAGEAALREVLRAAPGDDERLARIAEQLAAASAAMIGQLAAQRSGDAAAADEALAALTDSARRLAEATPAEP